MIRVCVCKGVLRYGVEPERKSPDSFGIEHHYARCSIICSRNERDMSRNSGPKWPALCNPLRDCERDNRVGENTVTGAYGGVTPFRLNGEPVFCLPLRSSASFKCRINKKRRPTPALIKKLTFPSELSGDSPFREFQEVPREKWAPYNLTNPFTLDSQ